MRAGAAGASPPSLGPWTSDSFSSAQTAEAGCSYFKPGLMADPPPLRSPPPRPRAHTGAPPLPLSPMAFPVPGDGSQAEAPAEVVLSPGRGDGSRGGKESKSLGVQPQAQGAHHLQDGVQMRVTIDGKSLVTRSTDDPLMHDTPAPRFAEPRSSPRPEEPGRSPARAFRMPPCTRAGVRLPFPPQPPTDGGRR